MLGDQGVGEVFYRLQVTPHMQLTPSFQLIIHPSRAPDEDLIGVFGIRFRTAF
jgi:hypothetical protein